MILAVSVDISLEVSTSRIEGCMHALLHVFIHRSNSSSIGSRFELEPEILPLLVALGELKPSSVVTKIRNSLAVASRSICV